ncbi:flippase [Candidatus Wolfebacteria bacterium]|nr:flippase [Candidatus Wolfebacteria bacterium]
MIKKVKKLFFSDSKTVRGTIFKNFIWLITGNAGSRFFKALIVIYATRKLGVEGYGVFSYVLGLAGFFTFFKNIGVDAILTREIAKKPEERHIYLSTSFWIEIVLLIITALLVIFIAPLFSGVKSAVVLFPFAALIFIFDDLRDLFTAFFRGKEKMELEALIITVGNISLVVFGFIALYFWPTPKSFIAASSAASFVGVLAAIFLLRSFINGIIKNFKRKLVMPILKSALPFAVGGLAGAFLFNVDIVMLGWWKTTEEIGFYSAAQKLVGILAIFPGFAAAAIFPSLSRFAHSDREKMKIISQGALKIIFIVAIPLIIGGFILKNSLISFIFGPSYAPAANVFAILLFSILAIHPLPILSNLLFAFDKQSKMIRCAFISSLCNLMFNFLLIPWYGMAGAAIATLISFFVYIILLWRETKKMQDFHIAAELLKPAIGALLMGFFTYVLKLSGVHVLANVIISAVFYLLCLYLLKEKILEEIFVVFKNK